MKAMNCLEVKNTVNVSVIDKKYSGLTSFYNGKLSFEGRSVEVVLSSTLKYRNPFKSPEEVFVKKIYTDSDDDATKLYEISNPSISYILISGFGGNFAQTQHLKFLRLLKSYGRPVLNIVIVPSVDEPEARKKAMEGIDEIEQLHSNLITYYNEDEIRRLQEGSKSSQSE